MLMMICSLPLHLHLVKILAGTRTNNPNDIMLDNWSTCWRFWHFQNLKNLTWKAYRIEVYPSQKFCQNPTESMKVWVSVHFGPDFDLNTTKVVVTNTWGRWAERLVIRCLHWSLWSPASRAGRGERKVKESPFRSGLADPSPGVMGERSAKRTGTVTGSVH